eukprot:TRINITY_DN3987_c0_g1_i1.p1 TRINITY_DN3987_c0_g1~~TRINITY_DN3987_c0_g1_i1.p1  ORF type:complete len:520 (-),score=61.75 TRINITY_DN3987_c0_g1_i1:35-1594(-)
MSLIIGSRAWNQDYEDSYAGSDWDVVVKKQDFINLLNAGNILDVSYDSLTDFKFRVAAKPKCVLEVEIAEGFKSAALLQKFMVATNAIDIGVFALPISPIACVVLKTSHITFPINWRKNALQLSDMKAWFKADSLNGLLESDIQRELFKQLLETRSRETLARVLAKTKSRKVDNTSLKEKRALLLDEQGFMKFAPINQSDTIYFPTTDTSVSRSKFASGTAEYKSELIQRQLELIAGLYFVDHAALAPLSPEARVAEIYLLSLQTFCCQQVAADVPVVDHRSLAQKTYHMYQRFRTVPAKRDVRDIVQKLSKLQVDEQPLASDEQVSASPLGNAVVQWVVDHWAAATLVPPQSFKNFVIDHSAAEHQIAHNITLPPELMEMILSHVDEHVTYCSLVSLNKYYRALYNSHEAWKRFTYKCWTEEQLKQSKAVKLPPNSKKQQRKQDYARQIRWREIFAEILDKARHDSFVLCSHCRAFHDAVAHGREARDEAYWDHCPCDDCDADSWKSCEYADDYTWED